MTSDELLRELLATNREILGELRAIRDRLDRQASGESAAAQTAHPQAQSGTGAPDPSGLAKGLAQRNRERLEASMLAARRDRRGM